MPSTQAGDYYILISGPVGPARHAATLTVKALPFGVTDVARRPGRRQPLGHRRRSQARDSSPARSSSWSGPGIAEVEPASYQVIDATKIIATFDLRDAPHGLYDVAVINPDGAVATLPYRFLVEDALPIDVTIGLGGPRVVPAGQTGLYSISLQSLTNVDTPYVYFTFGAPELGENPQVFDLPYMTFNSNVRGAPDGQRTDVPWASLDSEVNTDGLMLAPGYAFDVSAGGYVGDELQRHDLPGPEGDPRPRLRGVPHRDLRRAARADEGRARSTRASARSAASSRSGSPTRTRRSNDCYPLFTPFLFNVTASATPMTRDEFVAAQTRQAESCATRCSPTRPRTPRWSTSPPTRTAGSNAYLAALEESGMLRPEDQAPPIRQDPKVVSLMATLASGILVGPLGKQITRLDDADRVLRADAQVVRRRAEHDRAADRLRPSRVAGSATRATSRCRRPPTFADFDLGLSHPTYFQSVNVFSPLTAGGTDATVDPLFASLASSNTLTALDLQALFAQIAQSGAARRSPGRRVRRPPVRARPAAAAVHGQLREPDRRDDGGERGADRRPSSTTTSPCARSASATSRSAASRSTSPTAAPPSRATSTCATRSASSSASAPASTRRPARPPG